MNLFGLSSDSVKATINPNKELIKTETVTNTTTAEIADKRIVRDINIANDAGFKDYKNMLAEFEKFIKSLGANLDNRNDMLKAVDNWKRDNNANIKDMEFSADFSKKDVKVSNNTSESGWNATMNAYYKPVYKDNKLVTFASNDSKDISIPTKEEISIRA